MRFTKTLRDADQKIVELFAQHPGANIGQVSKFLLCEYSGAYVRDRIHVLIAGGVLRAEVNEVGRYRIFVADDHKPLEV